MPQKFAALKKSWAKLAGSFKNRLEKKKVKTGHPKESVDIEDDPKLNTSTGSWTFKEVAYNLQRSKNAV